MSPCVWGQMVQAHRRFWGLLVVALLLGPACATRLSRPSFSEQAVEAERREQNRLALSLLLSRQARVWRVGDRLRVGGAPLCQDDSRYAYGFLAVDRELFSSEYRAVADEVGLGPGVVVWDAPPGTPAAEAGLQSGDRIVRIEAERIEDFASFEKAMKPAWERGMLRVEVTRASGQRADFSIEGVRACDYPTAVVQEDSVNAFADGRNVVVSTGMIRFVASDDELALVLGHEMAHNALDHVTQKRFQTIAGLLVDLAVLVFGGVDTGGLFSELGGRVYSQEFEADADYLGLYLTARAGYAIHEAPDFWRRMAVEHPGGIEDTLLATHPPTPERSVALQRAIAEIEAKRDRGEPLVPEQVEE